MRRNYARKCGREFGTQRDFAVAFVCEIEKLLDDFRAAFLLVQLGRFQRRPFPFHEAVAAGNLTSTGEDIIPLRTVVRKEIAETG